MMFCSPNNFNFIRKQRDFEDLFIINKRFNSWNEITDKEYHELIDYMIKEYIEKLEGEAITGIKTENY